MKPTKGSARTNANDVANVGVQRRKYEKESPSTAAAIPALEGSSKQQV